MTENKELYDAPTLTAVELKQEGVICTSTLKTLWLGTESVSAPSNYGLQDYGIQTGQDW